MTGLAGISGGGGVCDELGGDPLSAGRFAAHRFGGGAGDGGDGGGQVGAAGQDLMAGSGGHGHRRGVPVGGEGDTGRRAAQRVRTEIGPVAAVLDAEHVAERQVSAGGGLADRVGEGGDERAGPVADGDDGGDLLGAQHRDGVSGDVGRGP